MNQKSAAGEGPAVLAPLVEQYVRLVLELGLYDADEVDAYYGPEEWKPREPAERVIPAGRLSDSVARLAATLQ
jgi:hypothetical protein